MEVSRIRALRGPNLWSRHTAIEAIVSCGETDCHPGELAGFLDRLRERFPEIDLLRPAYHHGALTMAHAFERATLGLQVQAGCPVTFSHTMETLETGIYQVVVEYSEEAVGRLAIELSQTLCRAAAEDIAFDLADAVCRLRALNEEIRLGPSTGAIVSAAVARGIPFRRLTDGSMVQFGWGSKQQRIQAAETGLTGAVAESIAQDKELTRTLLSAAGIPVPSGRPVANAEDAWAAACEIGGPVVVKPQDGNQGKGVAVNLVSREQVEAAYAIAVEISGDVLVERYIPGHDYRMLVVGNKLIAAARRDPPEVMGDGMHSVRQLVEQLNSDPRRGEGHANSLTKIHFDEITLAHLAAKGLSAESVPSEGTRISLRNNANLSTGGTATDVTDDVHPEFAKCVEEAAQMIGLDICGIDVVCDSVSNPLEEQGAVIEINAAPGLRMHLQPSFGRERAVGEAIIANMFKDGDDARIPVVAVSGTNGKTTTVRMIASILGYQGLRVGMTSTDGVYIDGQRIDTGDCSGPKSAKKVLLHPDVDAAVFETARGGLLREGLGFDRCNVAVVTNIGMGDHLGLSYINTVEDLTAVKRVIVQNVTGTGVAVLNAADPLVAGMAAHCPGSVTFFARNPENPVIVKHRAQGNRVIYLDGDSIVASDADAEHRIPLGGVPVTQNGTIAFQIDNAMAAAGAGWALGLDWEIIRAGLAAFVSNMQTAPGRFNLFNHRGATLIADYGHNADAIRALVHAIDSMPAKRRSVVISGAGDRRDEDIRQQTEILGDAFDEVVLYQDQCQRGRADGEVLGLLRQGLENAKRTRDVKEIRGEFVAIDTAFANLKAGELCLILVDQVEEALGYITKRVFAG
ncbi:cyanophycin synthetase [Nitrosospira sp. Nsp5]|uniref:Cyanophycin synthetase n=1 Tax=Nitrosospira multiformis TaxID=1231 RepID=A0ABY0TL10_9PROT|nr:MULTISPECIES: cyanophycin synthetase [Nitrosospira]PTR10008.1 cyanophycin synthetase [Nitrosospira sp. Nsp5]SDQ99389.1 cyanophycin synthetase [Nitrosospira multiformis]